MFRRAHDGLFLGIAAAAVGLAGFCLLTNEVLVTPGLMLGVLSLPLAFLAVWRSLVCAVRGDRQTKTLIACVLGIALGVCAALLWLSMLSDLMRRGRQQHERERALMVRWERQLTRCGSRG